VCVCVISKLGQVLALTQLCLVGQILSRSLLLCALLLLLYMNIAPFHTFEPICNMIRARLFVSGPANRRGSMVW